MSSLYVGAAIFYTLLMVALGTSKLFSSLSPTELLQVEQSAQTHAYAAGETLFKEGDKGDGIYLVQSGLVQISALVNEGERRVLSRLGPGEFFGEMAVLDNEPRSATTLAEEPTQAYFIPRESLLRILDLSPRLAVSLVREFSFRMREFNRRYIQEALQAERLTLVGRFARSIVHDFKNPLNVIGISAEMAAMETATPTMRASAKTRIRKQVDRLSNMINELLEFTRGTQASIVLANTDYAAYVQQIIDEIRPEIEARAVTLECENPPPAVHVLIDPARLTHVFYNLIHNAVDAMPDGGKVKLRFEVRARDILTEIEDTGQGIAPEILSRLFEAFATYGKAQGTGLGLSICRKIIQDHRGQITARSEPGRGAIFSFNLPLYQ